MTAVPRERIEEFVDRARQQLQVLYLCLGQANNAYSGCAACERAARELSELVTGLLEEVKDAA